MSPMPHKKTEKILCGPRASGDEPFYLITSISPYKWSPRERG